MFNKLLIKQIFFLAYWQSSGFGPHAALVARPRGRRGGGRGPAQLRRRRGHHGRPPRAV